MKRGHPLISLFTALGLVYLILNWKYGIFNLPFFWDELGVYSRASIHQAVHGLGLHPGSMPDVLSRGHPLLTPFLFGLSFKVFGISLTTARLTGAIIYSIGVLYAYLTVSKLTKPQYAAIAVFCIACQPAFLAQSILILPEILLTTLTLAAVFYFVNNNTLGVILALILAVMVKESALILPFAFAGAYYYQYKNKLKGFLTLLTPLVIFSLFIIIQKIQNGYFLYPLHQGLMDFTFITIYKKLLLNLHFIFIDQGRWMIFVVLLIGFAWYKVKHKIISFPRPTLLILLALIALSGIAFASINYFLARYTLYFLFPLLLSIPILLYRQSTIIKIAVVVCSLIVSGLYINNNARFEDTDFVYVRHVRCMETTFEFVQTLPAFSKIGYNWPMVMAFWSNESGYNLPDHKANEVAKDNINSFDYIVVSHPGDMVLDRDIMPSLQLIKVIEDGYANCAVYKVVK